MITINATGDTTLHTAGKYCPEDILVKVPAGSGVELPELTNEGTAADLLSGKELIDAEGNVVIGTIPTVGEALITPKNFAQYAVTAGKYTTGDVIVAGDSDLFPQNIKKGVDIFGVVGTYEGESVETCTFTYTTTYDNDRVLYIDYMGLSDGVIAVLSKSGYSNQSHTYANTVTIECLRNSILVVRTHSYATLGTVTTQNCSLTASFNGAACIAIGDSAVASCNTSKPASSGGSVM